VLNRTTKRREIVWDDGDCASFLIELAPGEFVMGENLDDKYANDCERPAHTVRFSNGVALGRCPVTVGEFRQFQPGHSPNDPEDVPVVKVSWHDAVAYCDWLTQRTGRPYRLPTEAEWEFACRAGSRTPFSSGEEINRTTANYLYDDNGSRIGVGHRTSVMKCPPNRFGFHDFHGNVCEWVVDTWHPNYIGAPVDGSAWIEPGDDRRVIRGGAWDYLPRLLRSAWRDWRFSGFRADNVGFRVAAEMASTPA